MQNREPVGLIGKVAYSKNLGVRDWPGSVTAFGGQELPSPHDGDFREGERAKERTWITVQCDKDTAIFECTDPRLAQKQGEPGAPGFFWPTRQLKRPTQAKSAWVGHHPAAGLGLVARSFAGRVQWKHYDMSGFCSGFSHFNGD